MAPVCWLQNIMFNATGSVVKQKAGSKRLLDYEISCQNLKSGDLRVPVAAFLSNDHTVSTISHFLRCFRDNEKKVFGYRYQVQPCILKVYFSMALIISILEVFNIKKMQDYLKWCWLAVSNTKANTNIYTLVHVCLTHFMKRVKEHSSKLFKGGMEIILYSFSLMANSLDMLEVKQVSV